MLKKLLAVTVLMVASGLVASHDAMALDLEQGVDDRINGTYTFECRGMRSDANDQQDWSLTKYNMDYVLYGIASHVVIKALNEMYGGLGDKALQTRNLPPISSGSQ